MAQNILSKGEALLRNRGLIIAAILGFILCLIGFRLLQNQLGAELIDMLQSYNQAQLETRILEYPEAARMIYAWTTISLDVVFPICYGFLYAAVIYALIGRNSPFRVFAFVPLVPVLLDFAENIQLSIILRMFPDISPSQIMLASQTTSIKWAGLQFVLLFVGVLIVVRLGLWIISWIRAHL